MIAAVTGATGFIGRSLAVRLAAEGHRVRCLVRDPVRSAWMADTPGLEPVTGDVLRPEDTARMATEIATTRCCSSDRNSEPVCSRCRVCMT